VVDIAPGILGALIFAPAVSDIKAGAMVGVSVGSPCILLRILIVLSSDSHRCLDFSYLLKFNCRIIEHGEHHPRRRGAIIPSLFVMSCLYEALREC